MHSFTYTGKSLIFLDSPKDIWNFFFPLVTRSCGRGVQVDFAGEVLLHGTCHVQTSEYGKNDWSWEVQLWCFILFCFLCEGFLVENNAWRKGKYELQEGFTFCLRISLKLFLVFRLLLGKQTCELGSLWKPDCCLPTYMTTVYAQANLYLYLDSLSQIHLQLHFADMLKLVTVLLAASTTVIGLLKWKLKYKAGFRDDCLWSS